ncbi:MAG: hypothetical protein KF774_07795 [Planctomyces sp.]|nr:hypothetical protein [Planctomyces sp.]
MLKPLFRAAGLLSVALLVGVLSGCGDAVGGHGAETSGPAPPSPKLIVHEWGTFTSFSGSDGVQIDYRPLGDNDLPRFVYSDSMLSPFSKRTIFARQRMETPVTYFYTDVEQDVRVSVAFPGGRLTEFYPPPRSRTVVPATDGAPRRTEAIDWGTVHLIPTSRLATHIENPEVARSINRHMEAALVPWTDNDNPYYHARRTDSALVYVPHRNTSDWETIMPASDLRGDHVEKFLFYRGTGNFDVPLRAEALGGDRFRIANTGSQAVKSAILVNYEQNVLRFGAAGDVPAGGSIEATLPPAGEGAANALDEQLVAALMSSGLYEKEARSMVATWKQAWYFEPGTRVLCLVPQELTDAVLPLTIEPQPQETLRVMVARLELMTPEEERHLLSLMETSSRNEADIDETLLNRCLERGRLAAPAIQRVSRLTDSATIRAEGERVLARLAKVHNLF